MVDVFFAAEIDSNIATIDLHDARNPRDALDQFERELARVASSQAQYVRVIHGIGSGRLRDMVDTIAAAHPLVVDSKRDAHGGSTILIL